MQNKLLEWGPRDRIVIFWAKLYPKGQVSMGWQKEHSNGMGHRPIGKVFQAGAAWQHLHVGLRRMLPHPVTDGGKALPSCLVRRGLGGCRSLQDGNRRPWVCPQRQLLRRPAVGQTQGLGCLG